MDRFIAEQIQEFRKINSGIHIALLGTNRGGKTTLATGGGNPERGILRHFDDVLVLDTTGDPGFISQFGKPINKWGAIHGVRRLTVTDMSPASKEKVYKTLARAIRQGNCAIYVDEIRQVADKKFFGLGPALDHIWLFEAKKGNSLIGGTQQPFWVPGAFYNQSKLHFIFSVRDKRSRDRLGEISGDTETLRTVIPQLKRYEFAMVSLDGDIYVSKFELKAAPKREQKKLSSRHEIKTVRVVRS